MNDAQLVALLRPRVAARLQEHGVHRGDATDGRWHRLVDTAVTEVVDGYAREELAAGRPPPDVATEHRLCRALVHVFTGAGGLQQWLDDPEVETVNINGADNVWLHYRDGTRMPASPVASSDEELVALLRELGAHAGAHERRFTVDHPELSTQLPGGARLHALQHVTDRPVASIRRHSLTSTTLDELVQWGTMAPPVAELCRALVAARRNIVVSGGPAVGKTTFLRALAHAIPRAERLCTVEDSYELSLDRQQHPNLVAMQAREANVEQAGAFSLDQCVRASLRLSPDRVIVGEVRGAEAVTMAKAMSIGLDGSLATVHASNSRQALLRLVTYAMEPPAHYPREAATALIAGAVHVVVHLEWTRDRRRVVASIREVTGDDGDQIITNEVLRQESDGRVVPWTRLSDDSMDALVRAGFDPAVLDREHRWA